MSTNHSGHGTKSLAGDKVCGICPSIVVNRVCKVVSKVFQRTLACNNCLNKESKHREHGQSAVLDLLNLELGKSLWVISKTQWVKAATRVDWVSNLTEGSAGNTITLNGTHQDNLASPNGQDALGMDQTITTRQLLGRKDKLTFQQFNRIKYYTTLFSYVCVCVYAGLNNVKNQYCRYHLTIQVKDRVFNPKRSSLLCKLIKMWYPWNKGPSGFSSSSTAEDVTQGIDATGLTAIVTGASSGIGIEVTRVLVLRGAHVIMAVRSMHAARKVKEDILKDIPNAKIEVMELDLSSIASVRKFASEYNSSGLPLNILINNAGVMASPYMLSQDGIEMQFATNHIGHFLLTNLLLEKMKTTAHNCQKEGRIVNVSSFGHNFVYREGIRFDKINDESSYSSFYAYGQSKLANILHASELARRLKEEGVNVTANSLHPGSIYTNLTRHQKFMDVTANWFGKLFLKTIPQGAATTCYVALNPQVQGVSGQYFSDCNIAKTSALAKDAELAKKLWDFSLSLTDPK